MKHCKTLFTFIVILVIGSLSCSKMETPEINAAPTTSSDQISLLGNWTTGQFTYTEKRPSDTTSGVTRTLPMVFTVWKFNQDGTVTLNNDAKSGSMAFTTLPDHRIVLTLRNSADTFRVQNTDGGILLTGVKNTTRTLLTETLELRRTSN